MQKDGAVGIIYGSQPCNGWINSCHRMRAFRYAIYIYCVPTARCLSVASILPAIGMAGYPITPLWGFFYRMLAYLRNLSEILLITLPHDWYERKVKGLRNFAQRNCNGVKKN